MSYQNNAKNNNAGFDAANFRIEAPVLPYSDEAPQFQIAAESQATMTATAPVAAPAAAAPQSRGPQKRQRATRQRANTAHSKSSRHQVSHPELVRILMTSQTNAMPVSPTNPASAKVRPTAAIQKGPVRQRMNAQQVHMAQQMDREKQMVLRGLGIVIGLVTLLIIGVKCFADETVKSPQAKPAAVSPATEAAKAGANKEPLASSAGVALPISALPPVFSLPQAPQRKGILAAGSASIKEQTTLGHKAAARLVTLPNDKLALTVLSQAEIAGSARPVSVKSDLNEESISHAQTLQLDEYYTALRNHFWQAERQMEERAPGEVREADGYIRRTVYLPPLEQPAALVESYIAATDAADAFLKIVDAESAADERTSTVLYLGGMANYTLGYKERALTLLQRLSRDYPRYRREVATNGRDLPNPRIAQPVAFGVNKLILSMKLQAASAQSQDSFAALKQFADVAVPVVSAQSDFKLWLASYPAPNQRDFDETRLGFQPDQRRASVLPPARRMVEEVYAKLIPAAIHQAGGKAVRDYLRTLITVAPEPEVPLDEAAVKAANAAKFQQIAFEVSAPKEVEPVRLPLADIIEAQLSRLDETIIEGYRQQARQLAAQNNIPGARGVLKTIIAEYPGTAAAQAAQNEIGDLTSRLTQQLRAEGDKKFNPAKQINVPQSEARAYFEKMYKEDPDGPQADYALMQWARALGTEGNMTQAIDLLKTLPEKFGGSEFEAEAKYMVGFYYGHNKIKKYDEAVACMEAVANEYPDSEQAPEALWHAAYFSYLGKKAENGGKYLDQLEKYTGSPRFKHIGELRDLLKKTL